MNKYPVFKCHKEVEAFKIGKIEGCRIFSEDGSLFADVSPQYIEKNPLNQPGYYVRYKDGYESFSPVDAFEDGYLPKSRTFSDVSAPKIADDASAFIRSHTMAERATISDPTFANGEWHVTVDFTPFI